MKSTLNKPKANQQQIKSSCLETKMKRTAEKERFREKSRDRQVKWGKRKNGEQGCFS